MGVSVRIAIDAGVFDEAEKSAEGKLAGKSEKGLAIIELQQEFKFEKSLANELMSILYMVWRRKNKEICFEEAPKTVKECAFGFERAPEVKLAYFCLGSKNVGDLYSS